jgi:hypothetical protein
MVNAGVRWSAHCFRTLFGMLSGPDALERFIFLRSFATPSCVILMLGMFYWTLLCVLGILLTFTLVKTDENCLIRICAFSSLLFIRCPRSFSGAIPMLSCFLDLTYFQKGFVLFFSIPSSIAEFI